MTEEIRITVPEQPEEQAEAVAKGLTWAEALVISGPEERKQASAGVAKMKAFVKQIGDLFRESKAAANAAHKAVCAAEKRLADPVNDAIKTALGKMLDFDQAQERIRLAEEAKLRAEAQARAEAEQRRLAAIAARCKDEAKREAYTEAAEAVVPVAVSVARADDRADGEIRKTVWKAELLSLEKLVVAAAGENGAAIGLLAFDQQAANRAAVAFKRDGVVPGVRFYAESQIQHRG